MALHITPLMVVRCYDFLRSTKPFSGWRLPDPDDIEFRVAEMKWYGDCDALRSPPLIRISDRLNGHSLTLLRTMAHEMIHLHLDRRTATRVVAAHGSRFKALAAQVCRHHGFDPKDF